MLPGLRSTAALALLAGCATLPPTAPASAGIEVPAQWSAPTPAGQGALPGWWAVFGDATLVMLVEQALQGNTDIGVARASVRQARALRDQAAGALLPTLEVFASAARNQPSGGTARNALQAGFDAAWEADLFGANRHGLAAQQAQLRARAHQLGATQVSVAAEVALSYLDLRNAQARAAVARENLATQEETLQISRWRQQAGLANAIEVEQALGAVEQTRAQLPALQAAAASAAHALGVLTGRTPQALLAQLATAAPLPQPRASLAVAIPAVTLRQRPDVLAAEHELRAAAEEVAAADAQRKPAVILTASLAWSGTTLGALGGASAARSLLASLAQPLFDGRRLDAQLAARQAAFDVARENYRASVLSALRDVEDALAVLAADRQRLASLQQALAAARNASLLASQRHASGLLDFQTVLDTQRTLLSVQDSVAVQQAALAADHVRLYKALGGGWQPGDAEKAS